MTDSRNGAIDSDADLQPGDVIFFESRANPSLDEKLVEFAQKFRGIKNQKLQHVGIVVGMAPNGTPLISHFTGAGHTVDRLDRLIFDNFPYRVMRPNDATKAQLISDAAKTPTQSNPTLAGQPSDKPAKVGNYSILKMISSFLRGNDKFALKKERKKVANKLMSEVKQEEICSSFVSRIIKKTLNTKDQKVVSTSYLLPGNLFESLENSKQFTEMKLSPDARIVKNNRDCEAMNQKFIDILSKYGHRLKQIAKDEKGDAALQHLQVYEKIKLIKDAIKKNIKADPQMNLDALLSTIKRSPNISSIEEKERYQNILVTLAIKAGIISEADKVKLDKLYKPEVEKVSSEREGAKYNHRSS